jgi:drug/metabolite transporter (DMT)-like permease
MRREHAVLFTLLAMLAFAANSVLCRLALQRTAIDPATFTGLRLAAGAATLGVIVVVRGTAIGGNWLSAVALFAYAAGFSLAYVSLPAATGALLLFGAVQVTMIGRGLWTGERMDAWQVSGLLLAACGLIVLLLPGLSAPPLRGAALMLGAGIAWGVYSLRGKCGGDATASTAGNFLRSVPMALVLVLAMSPHGDTDATGAAYAIASGALASGLGYALWYAALPSLKATTAATVQLSVPVLAAIGGVVLLDEAPTLRLLLASIAVLGGVSLVLSRRGGPRAPAS